MQTDQYSMCHLRFHVQLDNLVVQHITVPDHHVVVHQVKFVTSEVKQPLMVNALIQAVFKMVLYVLRLVISVVMEHVVVLVVMLMGIVQGAHQIPVQLFLVIHGKLVIQPRVNV